MKRFAAVLAAATLATLLFAPAGFGFGLKGLEASIQDSEGNPQTQAGSHPFALVTKFEVQTEVNPEVGEIPAGQLRDVNGDLPVGLTGSPFATPRCEGVDFATIVEISGIEQPDCPDGSAVGRVLIHATLADGSPVVVANPVFNLIPSPGVAAKLGFLPYKSAPVTVDVGIKDTPPFNVTFSSTNVTQTARVLAVELTIWGNPSDPAHDGERGVCGDFFQHESSSASPGGSCPTSSPDVPFLTLPRSCTGPLPFSFAATSWQGESYAATATAPALGACPRLSFGPSISAAPTSDRAQSPSGLDFGLDVADEGLGNPAGLADSDLKKAVVALPRGMTVNPSQAEGLAVCSESDFAREKAGSEFGAGCPAASKIGTTEVETPLLEGKLLKGSLFVAKPYENPFGSLIALYMTFKEPALGIGIKLAGKVEPDPVTGQLITTFDELPQQPFSHFRLHFREGARSPLITPPGCGRFDVKAELTPWANPAAPLPLNASFAIDSGPEGGPCPHGAAPFHPGFEAGTLSNAAGRYSPFYMRLSRADGEQDLTRFSSTLPPGVVGKIAGIARCPEAGIARAKSRTGAHGGAEELADPSCPAASAIGRTVAGAGVGSQLTYVPGSLYLAGPYHGDPLSVVSITPALAGPFDAGTVVVREALTLNPITAEVEVDGSASDPIPHILKGIPLNVRDLRVYADKPEFTLNATSCEEERARATLWGGGTALLPAAEAPVDLGSRYEAAGCAGLGFAPKLAIDLKGGTKRGAFPALKAIVTPRAGDANFAKAIVTLPHSAFLEQGHFGTVCTRVQFAAGGGNGEQCPAASVYGRARAWTPLLAEPAEGPVYLRSSSHNLPDLVVALKGPPSAPFQVELASRIDSKGGGIRSSFEAIPDIPVSKFVLEMQGAKKGLIVNSTNLCAGKHRAKADITGQNGRLDEFSTVVRPAGCGGKRKGRRGR